MQNEKLTCNHYHCKKIHPGFWAGMVVVGLVVLLATGAIFARIQMAQSYPFKMHAKYSRELNYNYNPGEFVVPQDASQKGELALIVNNLEIARQAVTQVAGDNDGSVYSTLISYASQNPQNGSMVIKVPQEKFASAFEGLKKIASQVVQESTSQVPKNYFYPLAAADTPAQAKPEPVAAQDLSLKDDNTDSVNKNELETETDSAAQTLPAITPAYPPFVQNQGYIKVVFVDYGSQKTVSAQNNRVLGMLSYANTPAGPQIMLIALGLKLLLLVVLIIILVIMLAKSLRHLRRPKKIHPAIHVVRQQVKTSARAVKVTKKK